MTIFQIFSALSNSTVKNQTFHLHFKVPTQATATRAVLNLQWQCSQFKRHYHYLSDDVAAPAINIMRPQYNFKKSLHYQRE